jgi:hypothetical protein
MDGFRIGEIPWARRQPGGLTCPFCGDPSATVSMNDLDSDPVRLELYCDSDACDAREFVVLLLRGNLRQDLVRADVAALRAVDDGTQAEQHADGLHDDFRSLGEVLRRQPLRDRVVLDRRQRPTRIMVEPLPDEEVETAQGGARPAEPPAPPAGTSDGEDHRTP